MDYSGYYKILGLSPGADEDQIRQAYRKMALKLHPDINKSPNAHQEFIQLCEAYEIIIRRVTQEGPPGAEYTWPTAEDKSDFSSWEEIRREAQERARKQAEMRFEKMQREHEAFQQSGLYDLSLILRYLLHIAAIIIAAGMLIFPVIIAVVFDPLAIFYLMLFWIIGGFLAFYIYSNRKNWFRLGPVYFNFETIREHFSKQPVEGNLHCFYCPDHHADGRPYEQTLLFIQDVKLQSGGPMVQQARYKRKHKTVQVPRCRKAFLVHFAGSLLKLLSILIFLVFIRPGSAIWSFIFGAMAGGILSGMLMLVTRTRPKTLFLVNPLILFKLIIWLIALFMISDCQEGWHIYAGQYLYLTLALLVFFLDLIADPIIRALLGKKAIFSLFALPEKEKELLLKGYQYYIEIPIWSSLYPILRWLF